MTDRPILFSVPLVRAILEGRKTVTRRPVRFPCGCGRPDDPVKAMHRLAADGSWIAWMGESGQRAPSAEFTDRAYPNGGGIRCPFGRPGDRLWVRETWACPESVTYYRATDEGLLPPGAKWRPSIHMPRWASRLTLEVVDVRAERLQSITEEDASAEGMDGDCPIGHIPAYQKGPLVYHFAQSWGAIYGKGQHAWNANPWVWRVEFRKVEPWLTA